MTSTRMNLARRAGAWAALVVGALAPSLASAHFIQQEPASWSIQDSLGSPQKSAPCGQADPGNTLQPTNVVTTYTQGQMITITINETVTHPGHYRVSIADKMANLPADPAVTADGNSACGSTVIATNPTLPLIADNLFPHTTAFNGPQTVKIQLPPNLTCTNCTLQVAEFMSNHPLNNPGGCFYHHCATVSIVPAGPVPDGGVVDASTGTPPADAATTTPPGSMSTGCSYYLGAAAAPAALYLAAPFALGLLLRRRRRAPAA